MNKLAERGAAAPFAPDWVSPPGDTIVDLLEERDWSQQQLADRLGFSSKHVNQLIKGKVALTEEAAIRLQSVLGASVGFWLTREAQYRERAAALDAAARHATMVPWLERFPIKDLMKTGALGKQRIDAATKPGLVGELLSFFGVASPVEWERQYGSMELAFRRSREDQADVSAISAWLRMGERVAEKLDGLPYDEARFRKALAEIRNLTCLSSAEFRPRMNSLLHGAGLAFVLVPALPRAHVSGVARWLNPHRPLIQLSLYGKQNDRFWFSFFHEAAHILLHSQQKKSVFLDDPSKTDFTSDEERQANAWACDFLITPEQAKALASLSKTKAAVIDFGKSIGIHPGIVVGRMQHDQLINVTWMNDLKVSFTFNATP